MMMLGSLMHGARYSDFVGLGHEASIPKIELTNLVKNLNRALSTLDAFACSVFNKEALFFSFVHVGSPSNKMAGLPIETGSLILQCTGVRSLSRKGRSTDSFVKEHTVRGRTNA